MDHVIAKDYLGSTFESNRSNPSSTISSGTLDIGEKLSVGFIWHLDGGGDRITLN